MKPEVVMRERISSDWERASGFIRARVDSMICKGGGLVGVCREMIELVNGEEKWWKLI